MVEKAEEVSLERGSLQAGLWGPREEGAMVWAPTGFSCPRGSGCTLFLLLGLWAPLVFALRSWENFGLIFMASIFQP